MEAETASGLVFLGVFGGGWVGLLFATRLPEHPLGEDTRDMVKLGMGVIGTTALVLGLLVASSKQAYEIQKDESMDARRLRWMLYERGDASVPTPLLVVVIVWLTVLFASFGLFAPRNGTVVATHFVCAVSIALATYMILDLGRPFRA